MNHESHDLDEWSRRVLGWADRHGVPYTIFGSYVRFEITKERVCIIWHNVEGCPIPNPVNTIRRLRHHVRPVCGDGIPLHDATDLFCHEVGRLGGHVTFEYVKSWLYAVARFRRGPSSGQWFRLDVDTGHAIATIRKAVAP